MQRSSRGLLGLLFLIPIGLVLGAFGYMGLMSWLEGETRGFWHSLAWAAETISTTGYGDDSTWSHPVMNIYVITWQFVGVFLVFLVVPLYLIPFLEERFEAKLPTEQRKARDHVLIFHYGPAVSTLVDELTAAGREYVIVEADEATARRAAQRDLPVVFGVLEDGVLEKAGLLEAQALVANGTDDENANAVLAAREAGFEGDVLCLVEDPNHARPLRLAGATQVFTPRHILGSALAARASDRIDPSDAGKIHVFDGLLQIREVTIEGGSELAGKSLEDARIGEKTGANVLARFKDGELDAEIVPSTVLSAGEVAVVAGGGEALDRFLAAAGNHHRSRGRFVVAGAGEVGRKVVEVLRGAGEDAVVIDREPLDGVDVVGDALDEEVLEGLGIEEARAVVLALDRDSATLFATVILRDIAPKVPVIARVSRAVNVRRMHQAGAVYALSISEVSGRMLAFHLLRENTFELHPNLEVLRVGTRGLVGQRPSDLELRRKTGCSIVAVDREGEIRVQLGSDFAFAEGDGVYVCGTSQSIARYLTEYPA